MQMSRQELPQLTGKMFVTDGGIETHMIFNLGQDVPDMSVYLLNMSATGRELMRDYYRAYIPICRKAGQAFLFDTNTWRANPDWGFRAGLDLAALRRANIEAVAFCRQMQVEFAAAGVDSIVSGVLGPRRDAWQHDRLMTVEESLSYHGMQVEAFAEAGADYVSAYTLTNVPEAVGIARLARRLDLPVVLSFTLETDGNLPGGKPLEVAINEVDAATGGYPAYYMIGGLRVNASMLSHAELDNSPELDIGDATDLAQRYARLLPMLPNIRVIGGCCGTDHRHIGAICSTCLPSPHQHH